MIEYTWNFYLGSSVANLVSVQKYQGDIFMGSHRFFLRTDTPGWNHKFKKFRDRYLPRLCDDWFNDKLKQQLNHEALVKEFLTKNNLQKVSVNG